MKKSKDFLFITLGCLCVVLALLGIFLPILPTTPFLILAAFLFSKGSQKLHTWLLNQKTFGPIIRDWEERGAINLKAKMISTIMIIILFSYTLFFVNVALWIKGIVLASGIGVLLFINTRPSH